MKFVLNIVVTCILLFVGPGVFSQEKLFSHYGLKEGLSQSVINCIFQDSEGYLWFGTQNGLNRFDGYSFKKFLHIPSNPKSIIDNWIYDIAEDKSGNLWIGTKKGLCRFDKSKNIFELIDHRKGSNMFKNIVVNGLCSGLDGNIILNANGLLVFVDPNTLTVKHLNTNLLSDGSIYDQNRPVMQDSHGNIWFGNQNGLAKFVPESEQFTYYNDRTKPLLQNIDVTALSEGADGNIWVGTGSGLSLFDPITRKFIEFPSTGTTILPGTPVRSIVTDSNGNVWLATENSGLVCLQISNKKIKQTAYAFDSNNPAGISHNIVYSLKIDKSDVLWVGTLKGIDKTDLKRKKFRLYRKTSDPSSINLADNVMASIFKDPDGFLWIGTWGSGLNLYNRKTGEIVYYASKYNDFRHLPNDFVHVIYKDKKNLIWLGTRNGLRIFDRKTKKFQNYKLFLPNTDFPDFADNRIYCMIENSLGNYLIGTANGLHELNPSTGQTKSFYAEDSTISANLVYSILEDHEKEIWIGTTAGLDRYNPKTGKFIHYYKNLEHTNSLIDNFVVSLCLASDGKIWIGTNSGLCTFDKKTGEFGIFTDFPSNVVYDIIEDKNQNMWLSGGLGLTRYNPENKEFITYNIEDGLQSNEFNIKACFKAPDGEMFFGGMNGFNSFYADSLQSNNFIPNVVITSLEKENHLGKQSINFSENQEIVFTHKDYLISIDFASLDFSQPEKNKYAYEMIGLSDKRVEYGNRRNVVFLNLSAGTYEFRVYGTNSDGVWNPKPAILKIKVLPPWWRSDYALVSYGIVLVLLIVFYIKYRERQLKHDKKVLEEHVKERTKEVVMQRDEIQAQRDEIESQKNFVTEQRDQIALKNREINDSILYAKRIQSAVIPSKTHFKENFSDFFVLYLPKDIVSGDFYWIKRLQNKCFFAVADCTGHGVPGAFVSMLGISFLNEILQSGHVESAGDFLDKLRLKIKDSMQQTGRRDEAKDGLDISLAILDFDTNTLEFAGANSHALLVQNEQLIQLAADKMPIGIHGREQSFNTKKIKLNQGDILYLFSDGYMDQFGGKARRKFMSKNFKDLLFKIHKYPMIEQRDKLHEILIEWRGECDQIDDITILGVKI